MAGGGGANPDRNISLPVHQIALVMNGVHLLENMKFDTLAERRPSEFALMVQPLKIKGGAGRRLPLRPVLIPVAGGCSTGALAPTLSGNHGGEEGGC